jgi:hypothetical protein
MREVPDPFFSGRETRSTRRNVREPEAPPADVISTNLTKNGTKRKGKGKATETLRKKPRLADSYLDPFPGTNDLDVLVPEPSLTPAQSDALSLSINANNLPYPPFDNNLDPQLSRMGQAALSASVETNHLHGEP